MDYLIGLIVIVGLGYFIYTRKKKQDAKRGGGSPRPPSSRDSEK